MKRSILLVALIAAATVTVNDAFAQAKVHVTAGIVKPSPMELVPKPEAEVKPDTIVVREFTYAGGYEIPVPYITDTKDAAGKEYDAAEDALATALSLKILKDAPALAQPTVQSDRRQLHLAGFDLQTSNFAKIDILYEGPAGHKLYLDGAALDAPVASLDPGTHSFAIKYLTDTTTSAPLKVSIVTKADIKTGTAVKDIFSLDYNTQGIGCNAVALSPSGKYYSLGCYFIRNDGKRDSYTGIYETASGKLLTRIEKNIEWMPSSDRYYFTEPGAAGERIVCVDAATNAKVTLAENVPQAPFYISPTEDFAIFMIETDGPKEGDVHQILTPDDRQPGWRNRTYLAKLDFATGALKRLTFGHRNAWLNDISSNGRSILFATDAYDLGKRPTSTMSLLQMDLETMTVDTLALNDGFIRAANYSSDGSRVAVVGSPEAFNRIGMDVPQGRTPNMYDLQLYVIDVATKAVHPLTRDFAPSVSAVDWSAADGKIYLTAEDKDCVNLFRIDPETAKAERLDNQEDYLYAFAVSKKTPQLIYVGQSLCSGDKVWMMNTKKGKNTLIADFGAERLKGVQMGEGGEYEFTSSRGDTINGFYLLPPDFDPSKKYPLLVHYYGGCSPSARYAIGSYSPQYYAAQGYVFYVVNPSGAAGFGQEFASRHVNTAGQGVAEDILEGVEHFCADHPYIDRKHIGCFSASYGGFMTQLLLAKSDIFAAGISHAGISDHTSYWGEGYWGYSYSEVSMAGSYPWSHKDLYVDNSPLYMADKIHTPLLFLHGSADTNVPIGESIQMFTALKLLGCDTAFVVVDGENHGIREYAKRRQWMRTISAWFAKYLKEDPTWWNELYPEKDL